ncbi:hypothetical protein Tsp_07875 [Trichinella spiralis]|uniref:hypothetical protein n=1 Tax=Trichinella spiralis TaxID=6334 RepID=UPI0001EFB276|nr:hypothetical protein Tsp_07875 [Trichinella spiralis]
MSCGDSSRFSMRDPANMEAYFMLMLLLLLFFFILLLPLAPNEQIGKKMAGRKNCYSLAYCSASTKLGQFSHSQLVPCKQVDGTMVASRQTMNPFCSGHCFPGRPNVRGHSNRWPCSWDSALFARC